MPHPVDLPVVDHHCHLSPGGEGVGAARRFATAGGTHLFLATQNYASVPPTSLEDYVAQFDTTEAIARQVHDATGVVVYLVLAPYPVDLVQAAPVIGLEAAVDLQRRALDLAGRLVDEQRAVALGEVGRPHFPVPEEVGRASEEVFRHALEVARDAGCPAVVHSADLDPEGYRRLAALAAQVSFPLGKLVKHYARRVLASDDLAGVVPSYLARRETVRDALGATGPWFLETDFLDDPHRPGAVLDLETVPRRLAAFASQGGDAWERFAIPFVDSVRAVYGLTPSVPEGHP